MSNPLEDCRARLAELNQLRPLQAEQERRILDKLRLDWDFHSNHLEGNSLTYGETKALILHGLTAQGKPIKDHVEITGHHEAIKWIEDLVRRRDPLTETVVRELHRLILHEDHFIEARTGEGKPTRLLVEVGRYKSTPNHVQTVTGEMLYFSSPGDTPIHMRELLDWYSEHLKDDPIEIASVFHHRFTRIHPFTDGNGRVARLVSNFILMMGGFPPVIIRTDEKDAYFAALRLADAGNVRGFAEYIGVQLLESLELMLRGARGEPVDEPHDVRKELLLLKQQFESRSGKVDVLRSPAIVQSAWTTWIRPLFEKFERKSVDFETFYLSREAGVRVGGRSSGDTFDQQLQHAEGKIPSATDAAVNVAFTSIRSRQHVDKSFASTLRIALLPTHNEVFNGEGLMLAEVNWDETPTQEELERWISEEQKRHLEFIRPLINRGQ